MELSDWITLGAVIVALGIGIHLFYIGGSKEVLSELLNTLCLKTTELFKEAAIIKTRDII